MFAPTFPRLFKHQLQLACVLCGSVLSSSAYVSSLYEEIHGCSNQWPSVVLICDNMGWTWSKTADKTVLEFNAHDLTNAICQKHDD